jgi:putative cell wall-binding protein
MSLPRRGVTALSLTIVVVLLGGMLSAYAAGTGTVDPPPRTAFLARADNPADALAAGPVAGRLGAPLFTTPSDVLDVHAREGLVAYDPELVILTGGPAALGAGVEDAVRAALPQATVRRVFGAGRTETARRLAETIDEYNPGFLPVDATALEAVDAQNAANAATLQGKAAADFLAADGTALSASMPRARRTPRPCRARPRRTSSPSTARPSTRTGSTASTHPRSCGT